MKNKLSQGVFIVGGDVELSLEHSLNSVATKPLNGWTITF